jgi:hypothetical protein
MANSKLKSISAVTSASEALNVASTVGTLNLYSLPLETFVVNFANSVKGDKPKVILELAVPVKGIGTIQIFAPSYLSFDEQRAHLAEYFEHGATINGADNQPECGPDGSLEGIFFKRYEIDGPNYEVVSAASALGKMKATGLNSSVMQFGAANTKLTRAQIETATSLQRGNYAKVAVQQEGGVMGWLANVLK